MTSLRRRPCQADVWLTEIDGKIPKADQLMLVDEHLHAGSIDGKKIKSIYA